MRERKLSLSVALKQLLSFVTVKCSRILSAESGPIYDVFIMSQAQMLKKNVLIHHVLPPECSTQTPPPLPPIWTLLRLSCCFWCTWHRQSPAAFFTCERQSPEMVQTQLCWHFQFISENGFSVESKNHDRYTCLATELHIVHLKKIIHCPSLISKYKNDFLGLRFLKVKVKKMKVRMRHYCLRATLSSL